MTPLLVMSRDHQVRIQQAARALMSRNHLAEFGSDMLSLGVLCRCHSAPEVFATPLPCPVLPYSTSSCFIRDQARRRGVQLFLSEVSASSVLLCVALVGSSCCARNIRSPRKPNLLFRARHINRHVTHRQRRCPTALSR